MRNSKGLASGTAEELDYRAAIAGSFLELSEACIRDQALEDALKYLDLAVKPFSALNRDLSSPRLEADLQAIARLLPASNEEVESSNQSRKPVCLHVLNEAFAFGGHTAMATRWMQLDSIVHTHSVVLLSQKSPIPDQLAQAVGESGGAIYLADQNASRLDRAVWLRNLAHRAARYVILHLDTTDLIAALAFGVEGGPPVLLVNHAAHVFWVGASTTDLVVNCRGSQLEKHWTKVYRGVENCATIPIPLIDPLEHETSEGKSRAREIIGLPEESILIMTSGVSYKYRPLGALDFLKTCLEILEAVPEAYLAVAGVIENDRWREAAKISGYRLRALGSLPRREIALLHQAADLYLEGFPFGSTTALLEAGLQGLPVVLSPAECPPPYGTDGIALDEILERSPDVEQYKLEVIRLCRNPGERKTRGMRVRQAIRTHHTGAGWREHLAKALLSLPPVHQVKPIQSPQPTPPAAYQYWCSFENSNVYGRGILEDLIFHALSSGLEAKITPEMKRACEQARRVRSGGSIPLPLLLLLGNYFLPLLPRAWALASFRIVKFFLLGGLLGRARERAARLFRRTGETQSEYGRHRYLQDYSQWFAGIGRASNGERRG